LNRISAIRGVFVGNDSFESTQDLFTNCPYVAENSNFNRIIVMRGVCVGHDSFEDVCVGGTLTWNRSGCMGWLRLVGSLKLQVSFAKEPYKRDDILQKRPIILRNLLILATPNPLDSCR